MSLILPPSISEKSSSPSFLSPFTKLNIHQKWLLLLDLLHFADIFLQPGWAKLDVISTCADQRRTITCLQVLALHLLVQSKRLLPIVDGRTCCWLLYCSLSPAPRSFLQSSSLAKQPQTASPQGFLPSQVHDLAFALSEFHKIPLIL